MCVVGVALDLRAGTLDGLASAMTIALAGTSIAPESCYPNVVRLQYVGLNSWIPAEPRAGPCPTNKP